MRNNLIPDLFLVLVFLASAAHACDEDAAGGTNVGAEVLTDDLHCDDLVPDVVGDVDGVENAGVCLPTSVGQFIEADMPGVQVFGTGHLGAESIRVVVTGDPSVEFTAGTFFEPKAMASSQPKKRPQRMMIAGDFFLQGPGEFLIDANCMQYQQLTPDEQAEFYSCPQEPATPVQLCQRDCGNSQGCIWACQGAPESMTQVDIELYVIDDCDDGLPLLYRFFDRTSGQVWPEAGVYQSLGPGIKTINEFTCTLGNKICLGGESNNNAIGVGLDGALLDGEDWCLQCGMSYLKGWELGCG